MADKKISELTAAGALDGTELVGIVQGGTTVQTTTQDIADLGGGGGGGGDFVMMERQVLGANQTTITFATIDQQYEDLQVVVMARGTNASTQQIKINFNSDTGSNYDFERLNRFGAVTGVADTKIDVPSLPGTGAPSGVASSVIINLVAYSRTVFHKTLHATSAFKDGNSAGSIYENRANGHWRNTAAISTITLTPAAGDFATGSVFTLYGKN